MEDVSSHNNEDSDNNTEDDDAAESSNDEYTYDEYDHQEDMTGTQGLGSTNGVHEERRVATEIFIIHTPKMFLRVQCSSMKSGAFYHVSSSEAEFLEVIGTKVLRVFFLAIQSPLQTDFTPPPPPPRAKGV